MDQRYSAMDVLNVLGVVLAVLNYQENLQQSTNSDIMEELHKQNTNFLESMIEKIDKILSILDGSISA